MSKFVKNIITEELKKRLEGVDNALLVNLVGMAVNDSNRLRGALAEKDIKVMVIKNSLAARATADTPLAKAFVGKSSQQQIQPFVCPYKTKKQRITGIRTEI